LPVKLGGGIDLDKNPHFAIIPIDFGSQIPWLEGANETEI